MRAIQIVQGDDVRITINVVDSFGDPVNLEGASAIKWGVAATFGGALLIEKTLADMTIPSASEIYFDVTDVETGGLTAGRYIHEMEVTTAGGLVYTPVQGRLEILPDIL